MKKLIILLMIPIMISGQTVTEKIKAKFKQINDAKIERLKECEELTFFTATTPATLIMKKEHGEWLKEFITLWDEYAKECYADSTLLYTASEIDEEKEKEWQRQNPDGSKIWVFTKPKNIYISKQPDPIGFIEFLRNKLKEN